MATSCTKAANKAYNYVLADSYQNAEKLKEAILASTRSLPENPEKHPPEKYRKGNDKRFRAYEIKHYRIAYKVTEKEIIIVRIRHTKMEPLNY